MMISITKRDYTDKERWIEFVWSKPFESEGLILEDVSS